tara:strand:+ start:3466 stop:4062 length:597 start_codon:yes stop_codon:yes gene_type:complete
MFLSTRFINKTKPFIFILLILPSLFWLTKYLQGNFGVNPIDKLMDEIGRFSLKLIILTLLISSLSKFRSLGSLQNLRRMIGLFVFYYVSLHFLTYIFLDHYFNFNFIIKDIAKRPFITFGFISFLFLVPLAITSTNYMVKLLSFKIWKRLHYLIYPVAILASLHFLFLKKADKTEPLIYLIIITMLLLWRIFSYIKKT